MLMRPPESEPVASRLPVSRLLTRFVEGWSGERIRLGDLVDALEDRAFGLLLLIFAAPNVVPNPVPGLSGILGVPLVLVAGQLVAGRPHPWFPPVLANRSMRAEDACALVARLVPWLERAERLLRPRLRWLCRPPFERGAALTCLVLAVVLALPIPLGNILPALAICLIALGMVEHDGLALGLGVVLALLSLALVAGVVLAMAKAALFMLGS